MVLMCCPPFSGRSLPVLGAWVEMPMAKWCNSSSSPSLPVLGAWVEMLLAAQADAGGKSLPVLGAWVEIRKTENDAEKSRGRSPCWERGLKLSPVEKRKDEKRRSPCWERGLKCAVHGMLINSIVAPRVGSVG